VLHGIRRYRTEKHGLPAFVATEHHYRHAYQEKQEKRKRRINGVVICGKKQRHALFGYETADKSEREQFASMQTHGEHKFRHEQLDYDEHSI